MRSLPLAARTSGLQPPAHAARIGVFMRMAKSVVAVAFLIAGTAVFTYATTRTCVTKSVLTRAADRVSAYLESKNLKIGASNIDAQIDIDTETNRASRQLVGQVLDSGGMYSWWNDAIPYWGASVLLLAVGLLVPFVTRSAAKSIDSTRAEP
jgi:hypothetical protein